MIKITHYQIRNGYNYPVKKYLKKIDIDIPFYYDEQKEKNSNILKKIENVKKEMHQLAVDIARKESNEKNGIKTADDVFFIYIDTLL